MRRLIIAALFTLGVPGVGAAAPCVPDSLANYIALGVPGCSIGFATVGGFSHDVFDPLALLIGPAEILVTPNNLGNAVRLDFGVEKDATPGFPFFDAVIGYSLSAPVIRSARLTMAGATATPDGVVTGVEDICVGDVFASDPSNCQGASLPPLIVFQDGFGNSQLVAQMNFSPASFFDVFTEIAIDAGPGGTAGLNGIVSNQFSARAVAEPSTVLLLGAGLLALARRRKSKATDYP